MAASTASSSSGKSEFTVGGRYRLVRKIGSGSFGDIYLGVNQTNGEVREREGEKDFINSKVHVQL